MTSMATGCNLENTSENIKRIDMSETLLMELLDDSSYVEQEVDEDDKLGRVIQSLQAEISNVDMVISADSPFDACGLMNEMIVSDIDGVEDCQSDWTEMVHMATEFMEECFQFRACCPLYYYCEDVLWSKSIDPRGLSQEECSGFST